MLDLTDIFCFICRIKAMLPAALALTECEKRGNGFPYGIQDGVRMAYEDGKHVLLKSEQNGHEISDFYDIVSGSGNG